jgi:hypothetical protein
MNISHFGLEADICRRPDNSKLKPPPHGRATTGGLMAILFAFVITTIALIEAAGISSS